LPLPLPLGPGAAVPATLALLGVADKRCLDLVPLLPGASVRCWLPSIGERFTAAPNRSDKEQSVVLETSLFQTVNPTTRQL
jgi:hypothetical protein